MLYIGDGKLVIHNFYIAQKGDGHLTFYVRRHSVYCLVDEVLRCDEIKQDEKKNWLSCCFFLRHARKIKFFLSKKCILVNTTQFVFTRCYFPDVTQQANFILFFFPPPRRKNTLSDLVDQTIYLVSPQTGWETCAGWGVVFCRNWTKSRLCSRFCQNSGNVQNKNN